MKRLRLPIFLLSLLLPTLAAACLPPIYYSFDREAVSSSDAVIGHFSPASTGLTFIVDSSLRGSVKPGRYNLLAWRMGPPEGSACPFKPGLLDTMPNGATADQTWVLLIQDAKPDTLNLGSNQPYAVQRVKDRLISYTQFRDESNMAVKEKAFARWFISKPAQADAQEQWEKTAPVWQKIN